MRLHPAWTLLLAAFSVVAPGASAYDGPLVDTHAHLDSDGGGKRLLAAMDAHGVDRTLIFVGIEPDDPKGSWDHVREELGGTNGRFMLSFHVDPKTRSDIAPERLARSHAAASDLLAGFGESAFYREPWLGSTIEEGLWPEVFELCRREGLFLMVHLTPEQGPALGRILEAYPEVHVLLHGWELLAELPELLRTHENLWFTVDTSVLLVRGEAPALEPLLYPMEEGDAASFVEAFDATRDVMLADAVERWRPVIYSAPDRVMWGTDTSFAWHLDAQVYGRIVAFSRAFMDALGPEVAEPYAHGNADRLLGRGVAIPEADEEAVPLPFPMAAAALLVAAARARRRR